MVKANKKLILKIILLVLVLVATVVGLVYFVNWKATENYVTCVIALKNIDSGQEILTKDIDTYFKEVKQVIPDTQKGRVPITLNNLREETYYTVRDINAGDIIYKDYDLSSTSTIGDEDPNRIDIPLSVNFANVSGGTLNWNEKVMIYGYGNLKDSNGNTEWRTVLASNNALVKEITTSADGSSQYYTFEVDKSDVATIYYLNSTCQLFFLPTSIGDISEESATEIIQSLIGIEGTSDGTIKVYEPYNLSVLETNATETDAKSYETIYNLKVITNKEGEADKGFNLEWSNFKPSTVTIRHTSLSVDDTDFNSWSGIYTVNNSDLSRRITFDKTTGLYSFARQDLDNYTFGEEGYYEINMEGSKVVNRVLEDGSIIQEKVPVYHIFRFLIINEDDLTPYYEFVPTLDSKIINTKFNIHYNSDFSEVLHEDQVRFLPKAFVNTNKEELESLRYLDFSDLSSELAYKDVYTTVTKPNGGLEALQTINVGRKFASELYPEFVENYEGTVSMQKVKDFAKYIVYVVGGTINYSSPDNLLSSLKNTEFDENMLNDLTQILTGEITDGNYLYDAIGKLTTSEYDTLLRDLIGNPNFVYVPSTADTTEGDTNIINAVKQNTNLDENTQTFLGRNGTLNYDLCNIFLGELTKKENDGKTTLTYETNVRLTNIANYQVAYDYLAIDVYYQNYASYIEDNDYVKVTLQGSEVGNSKLNIAVDGLN